MFNIIGLYFYFSMSKHISEMDEDALSKHVEALAKIILEKPKRMSEMNGKYRDEIWSKHLNFDRDEIEVRYTRYKQYSCSTCDPNPRLLA